MNNRPTENAGYTIFGYCDVSEHGVAIAERTSSERYCAVTWEYRVDTPNNFYWGHYFGTKAEAIADFVNRLKGE